MPLEAAEFRMTRSLIDCQSHLFFPEGLDMMRKRQSEPLVYDQGGTTFLKMGDWLRQVPPKEILDPFHSLNLPAAIEAKIVSGNARRLSGRTG